MRKRILGALIFIFWFSFVIFFNLFVGHVRDGIETFGLEEGLRQAVPAMQNATFELNSAFSWFLFLLGIVFSLIALMDRYASDDPYPGYGDKSGALELFEENLLSLREKANSEQERIKIAAVEEGDKFLALASGDLRNHKATVGFLTTRTNQQFPEYCEYYKKSLTSVVDSYREANRQLRQTSPPAYFSEEFHLSWEKLDVQSDFDNIDRGFKRLEESAEQSQRNWPTIQSDIMNFGELV